MVSRQKSSKELTISSKDVLNSDGLLGESCYNYKCIIHKGLDVPL
uniref:Uncharacterized protein n=1 Tax=Rhizophora mucronata TaxID=61149 RepID=A0A2P2PB72_RHIMU